jgi:hypothetical protein
MWEFIGMVLLAVIFGLYLLVAIGTTLFEVGHRIVKGAPTKDAGSIAPMWLGLILCVGLLVLSKVVTLSTGTVLIILLVLVLASLRG